MASGFYIPRILESDEKCFSEDELLASSRFIVILAEPGGGKTELLSSLATKLGVSATTAIVFGYAGTAASEYPLVIDAFDELAKIDQSGIHKILGNAAKANPTHLVISSRSSEWNNGATLTLEAFFGSPPTLARLREFDEAEQHQLFRNHAPDENFEAFRDEVSRFDLEALLPNPQFLKLFADAYLECGRKFPDKQSIFQSAVERLAKEANKEIANPGTPLTTCRKIGLASEVFAKLLIAGGEGVSSREVTANRSYPLIQSLCTNADARNVDQILRTKLFKPGCSEDVHRPVHKIVAEYCAALYLTKRIANAEDSLSLSKCLSVIAPGSCVRDELRGMVGWMAALGNQRVEETLIRLDPYAVLANGDPSQLSAQSKQFLISQLEELGSNDPYFRRGDFGRRFSVAGFFTDEVVEKIRPLLSLGASGHLRNLVLEILLNSPSPPPLECDLQKLVLNPAETEISRLLASECLVNSKDHDHRSDVIQLITEASPASLKVAARLISNLGIEATGKSLLVHYFRGCSTLYPNRKDRRDKLIGANYFVNRFIHTLDLCTAQYLLDELSGGLVCTCGNECYDCDCRNGMSKVLGSLLDRYFQLASPPFDPARVWQWTRNLNFHEHRDAKSSKAVAVLQEDTTLRRGIIALVFGELNDREKIHKARLNHFDSHAHSGLHFYADDWQFVRDLAFVSNNHILWASFIERHPMWRARETRGTIPSRRQSRLHALKKPAFMKEWVKANREDKKFRKRNEMPRRHTRLIRRRDRREHDVKLRNRESLRNQRSQIESGQHWDWLRKFADLTLFEPETIGDEVGDEALVRTALRNCVDFISPHVPSLEKLAQLQCASQSHQVERVLAAASFEIMRTNGSLAHLDTHLLEALRTDMPSGYVGVTEGEKDALEAEVNKLLFAESGAAEKFLRRYLEPQLAFRGCSHPEIWLLRSVEPFSPLGASLSIEWLRRFPSLRFAAEDPLFDVAAQYADRAELENVISDRCSGIAAKWSDTADEEFQQKRVFWFVRHFYFIDDEKPEYWDCLAADRNTVFVLHNLSGRFYAGYRPGWPKLTPPKVEAVLNAFIDKWPKVDLPNHWGTDSPSGETAYRFLRDAVEMLNSDTTEESIPVLDRLLQDSRFSDFHSTLLSIRADQIRAKALRDFSAPSAEEVGDALDRGAVVTVDGLRQLILEELDVLQGQVRGGEFDTINLFYDSNEHLSEPEAAKRVADRLSNRLAAQNISIEIEDQFKSLNRCDITATKLISGRRKLLVIEAKGQWHRDLYTAAKNQLHEKYSVHPDAEDQGIYLIFWYGHEELVAARKNQRIKSAQELKVSVEDMIPSELIGLVDVFVLDLSK